MKLQYATPTLNSRRTAKNCPLHLQWRKQQSLVDPNYPAFISGFGVKQEQGNSALQGQRAALSDLPGKKLVQHNNYRWSQRNVLDQTLPLSKYMIEALSFAIKKKGSHWA